ncbi:hypothetical protein B2J93_6842 [Marssonina coronariae]|uniref:Uncharacterized protein n=1 Tax=Diplocarpon coronariae TaxID=2795749 RepID=A0A218YVU8_9HELO|nr:hypothetical protein B2J93_6842 [Marssonina coronariae]
MIPLLEAVSILSSPCIFIFLCSGPGEDSHPFPFPPASFPSRSVSSGGLSSCAGDLMMTRKPGSPLLAPTSRTPHTFTLPPGGTSTLARPLPPALTTPTSSPRHPNYTSTPSETATHSRRHPPPQLPTDAPDPPHSASSPDLNTITLTTVAADGHPPHTLHPH